MKAKKQKEEEERKEGMTEFMNRSQEKQGVSLTFLSILLQQ